ncbi:tyrosine-type recombinase/integrase [Pectinatus haikarae]|uniref:Integrase n=1 Tax=Pectinatus haikarae TaxID=349096 RepID=A0ABT9Y3W2_9FIRM|nr:site-specific integrase [Pectinatus haikarae]MDQ0202518.1 integrase [Pectinatus haikarae]
MSKNGNGTGSVYYDKSKKRYYAAITTPAGQRKKKSFITKTEATTWKNAQLTDINRGVFVEPTNITVGAWALTWLTTYKKGAVKQRTYERYKQLIAHLASIADIKLQELQPAQVQQLYKELPLSACTVNKVHKILKELYTKAHILDMVLKNIMLAVVSPTFEKKEIEIFSPEEIEIILQTCFSNKRLSKYYPIILLGATTGMRIGEILGLRWCDVLFSTSEVYIRKSLQDSREIGLFLETPKTKAGIRKISITEDVIAELRKLKKAVPAINIKQEQLCFVTRNNTPIAPHNAERVWKSIITAAGIPYRNFHVLRHTHATQLLAEGVPIIEVSRRLGHARVSHTLELYGHAIPNYDKKISDKVKLLYSVPK